MDFKLIMMFILTDNCVQTKKNVNEIGLISMWYLLVFIDVYKRE